MKQKIYRTKRLELRELRFSDWKIWRAAHEKAQPKQNDWDINPAEPRRRTETYFRRTLIKQRARFKKNEVYLWSVFLKDTGDFIGWIDISTINRDRYSMANLGWFILNTHRKNGYAKEATLKLISAAFADLKFHRLEASIDPRNVGSLAVAKSCGLRYEGLKKFYLNDEDGKGWQDRETYITTPELFYAT